MGSPGEFEWLVIAPVLGAASRYRRKNAPGSSTATLGLAKRRLILGGVVIDTTSVDTRCVCSYGRERLARGHRRPARADVLQHRHRHLRLDRHQPSGGGEKARSSVLDAREIWTPGGSEESKRSLGDKRRYISSGQIEEIVCLYRRFKDDDCSKRFANADFGFTCVTVERPLRLRHQMTIDDKARFLDAYIPLADDINVYFEREVRPYVV